jgi:hypothetical protein
MATKTTYPEQVRRNVDVAIGQADETSTSIADGTGIPRSTMRRRLIGSSPFTVAEVGLIAIYLKTTPEDLAAGHIAETVAA